MNGFTLAHAAISRYTSGMSTSLARPPGYQERVKLVLDTFSDHKIADLAADLGVAASQVSRWRSGETVPSDPATLARLAGVDLALMVYGPTADLRAALVQP